MLVFGAKFKSDYPLRNLCQTLPLSSITSSFILKYGNLTLYRADSLPKVSPPSVQSFNDKVCIDLMIFGGGERSNRAPEISAAEGLILHLTYVYSSYHQSVYVPDKNCETIAGGTISKWI